MCGSQGCLEGPAFCPRTLGIALLKGWIANFGRMLLFWLRFHIFHWPAKNGTVPGSSYYSFSEEKVESGRAVGPWGCTIGNYQLQVASVWGQGERNTRSAKYRHPIRVIVWRTELQESLFYSQPRGRGSAQLSIASLDFATFTCC